MLKGVNKQIIEINDIENEYFYKAILFVRPESSPRPHEYLSKRANEYILYASCDIKNTPDGFLRSRESNKKRKLIIGATICSILIATATVLLIII
ncbi:MAG: hypothetical protein IKV36_01405 [Clostridia bacterium]|nr:hypothetical protein [Clostridia bacterium]